MSLPQERELIAKLVKDWHLSVPERNELPDRAAKGSLIASVIEETVKEKGWYPPTWRPENDFDGGLIEKLPNSSYRILWKAESGLGSFQVLETQLFATAKEACSAYALRFFGSSIDGIHIDWSK